MSSGQSELAEPPSDGISAMVFAPDHNLLLISSWNSEVSMYDVLTNTKKIGFNHKVRTSLPPLCPHERIPPPLCEGQLWVIPGM